MCKHGAITRANNYSKRTFIAMVLSNYGRYTTIITFCTNCLLFDSAISNAP